MRFKYIPNHHRHIAAQGKMETNVLHISHVRKKEADEEIVLNFVISNGCRDEEAEQFIRENTEIALQLAEQAVPEQLTDREGRQLKIHSSLADQAIREYLDDPQNDFSQRVGEIIYKEKQDESKHDTTSD